MARMFLFLPPALVALILASPALAVPRSFNDPFKALAARVVKPPEPPICCLTPLPPTELPQDDVLLSFEEWKEKRFAMQTLVQAKEKEKDVVSGERTVDGGDADTPAAEVPSSPAAPQDAPHFRVPVTDRFNYASLDCSARVHTSHRSAKSPASILSSKRDRYMLSPCRPPKGEQQFVVVELCEDIRIDTVQLANFEFFSGVFKDFTVSVSKTYTTDPEGWTFASTHTAKNIRVVQSFHLPTSLRDFYRYIRIDFHSHYSNEYYCPISLLRVYGLTHLEEYKWDIWETESRARTHLAAPSPPLEVNEPEPAPAPDPVRIPASYAEYMDAAATEREREVAQEAATAEQGDQTSSQDGGDAETASPGSSDARGQGEPVLIPPPATSESSEAAESTTTGSLPTTTPELAPHQPGSELPFAPADTKASTTAESTSPSNGSDATVPAPSDVSPGTALGTGAMTSGGSTVSALATTSVAPAPINGGESIYRTIMNRLAALEANHTLYARYVEEHTGAVREMLRRVGEDLGRADGVGKAQAQMHARTLREWERQRSQGEAEYRELMRRVEYLSDEIVLEKRLGIAQLLLLLAVLVFMTLTRGSRGESVMAPLPSVSRVALRAWGRRHLSLKSLSGSGEGDWDWVGRLKSRSRSPTAAQNPHAKDDPPSSIKLEFPAAPAADEEKPVVGASPGAPGVRSSKPKPTPPRLNLYNSVARPRSRTRSIGSNTILYDSPRAHSRTPTLARTPYRRPATPTQGQGRHTPAHAHAQYTPSRAQHTPLPMQQSLSQGHAPRSARRWARTAHLHELRGGGGGGTPTAARTRESVVSLGEDRDVFASPVRGGDVGGGRGGLSPSPPKLDLGVVMDDAGEGDSWVDTDEGSEMEMEVEVAVDRAADGGVNSPWTERVNVEQVAVGA
ncbi:UNC-like C-terminal-domain-containing protein [Mycena maculata]|uniref:UNC-like C-terminal-domain-containing protein n=1 Tax=Mycena maculata TaxID=230809 RepID=A0AAD7K212_9AGAR|nr:UNC-like C-terminal-domain-containing protein [Mycena maculata]